MRPQPFVAILSLCAALAGCATSLQRQNDAWHQADLTVEDCKRRGESSTAVAVEECWHSRARKILADANYPYMDLVDLLLAYRLALARRVDEYAMPREEANLMITEMRARINAEIDRRNSLRLAAQAQQTAAYGALLQGLAIWSQSQLQPPAPSPVYVLPPPATVPVPQAPVVRPPVQCFGQQIGAFSSINCF
jgi:hypothetical protein